MKEMWLSEKMIEMLFYLGFEEGKELYSKRKEERNFRQQI